MVVVFPSNSPVTASSQYLPIHQLTRDRIIFADARGGDRRRGGVMLSRGGCGGGFRGVKIRLLLRLCYVFLISNALISEPIRNLKAGRRKS